MFTTITASEARPPFFWGIDIGGTAIKLGLVDDLGRVLAFRELPTDEPAGPDAALARVAEQTKSIAAELAFPASAIAAAGLGTPGNMDIAAGMLLDPPNLPHWWNYPIRERLSARLDLSVEFLNDANAAAFGEYWLGGGKEYASMVMLTLGTGVGAGVIIDGHLVHGKNSFGGECGHLVVDSRPDADVCVWGGGRGQLEAYASASAVVQRTRRRLASRADSLLASALGRDAPPLTAKRIYEAACQGDGFANEIIDETAIWLGVGVTSMVHLLDPGRVVFGGAMTFGGPDSSVGRRFLRRIEQEFHRRTFAHVAAGTSLSFAVLGSAAGFLGAAGYARQQYSGL